MAGEAPEPEIAAPLAFEPRSPSRRRQWLVAGVLPLLVLTGGLAASYALLESAPQAQRASLRQPPQARLVEVKTVVAGTHPTRIETVGTVVAARQSTLYPQVAGQIMEISPELLPGGRFAPGEIIVRIDDADYRLAVRQRESAVAQAEATLQQERGQQANARAEYALLGRKLSPEQEALVLRRPQLSAAEAALAGARAMLEQARLELARTRVEAPFAGMVVSRSVDLGTRVTSSTPLVVLLDTTEFWLQASVPLDQLRWLAIPEDSEGRGSGVRLRSAAWDPGVYRSGSVLRLAPDLDGQGRLARLYIRISDPLALAPEHQGLPKVLLNDFLSVEIQGEPLKNVVSLERGLLRDGDRVWILNDRGKLEIRPIRIAFRGADQVLIDRGLASGEQVVATGLAAPVPGMALRARTEEPDAAERIARRSEEGTQP